MRIFKLFRRILPVSLVSIGFSIACQTPSAVDEHFGEAHAANKTRMIANPEAGVEPDDGVTDLEGVTVEGTLERYRREQRSSQRKVMPTSILLQGMPSSN